MSRPPVRRGLQDNRSLALTILVGGLAAFSAAAVLAFHADRAHFRLTAGRTR